MISNLHRPVQNTYILDLYILDLYSVYTLGFCKV